MNFTKTARFTLIVVGVLTLFAVFSLRNLKFDYDFENFFPKNDPDLSFFLDYREKFTPDTDFILIGIESGKSIFRKPFLDSIAQFTDSLKSLPFVQKVNSPTNLNSIIIGPFGINTVPYLHLNNPVLLPKDSIRIFNAEQLMGSFFSTTGKGVSIMVSTDPYLSKKKSDVLAKRLNSLMGKFQFYEIHSAGRMTGQLHYINKMQMELGLFILISIVILVVFLWISFRAFWGIWVPIVVVMLTAIFLLSLMSVTNKPIDVLTAILPTILFVVGISDLIHIISRYLEELRNGKEKIEALKVTFKEIGMATFLTTLTTAIGFITLITVNIGPIQEFGLYTAAGVFIAFILSFLILPSILMLSKKPHVANKNHENLFWYPKLHASFKWLIKNKIKILSAFGIAAIISVIGLTKIEVNNYLLEDLTENDPIKKDFVYFEKKYAGVRPFELHVALKDTTKQIFDYQNIVTLQKVEAYLKTEYKAGFLISPVSFVKTANQAFNGGKIEFYTIPKTEAEYQKIKAVINRFKKLPEFSQIMVPTGKEARFTGKMEDVGGKAIKQKNIEFEKYLKTIPGIENFNFKLTGTALLIDKNNEFLAKDMMMGLLLAFLVIGFIMGLLYRSMSIVVIALIPNIFPLIAIVGIMGFSGIDLKVSTAIIFTIAFGIAVDDTIHYMSKLKLELSKGKTLLYAIKRTHISTGKAIIVTSIILCSGFISLIFSTFAGTFYVGLLVSATLLFAVLSDLFLLPILLMYFYKPKKVK